MDGGVVGDANVKKELGSLISFLEHEEDPWGIKDLKSEFIYANNLNYLNLPKNFKIEGLLDSQLPHPVAELAPKLQEHDKRVMQGQKLIPVIQTHFYHSEHKLQPYLFEKRPYYNERDELIGTIYHGKKLNLFSLQRYITGLTPSVLMLEPPNKLFTKKELMVIFLHYRGLLAKKSREKCIVLRGR